MLLGSEVRLVVEEWLWILLCRLHLLAGAFDDSWANITILCSGILWVTLSLLRQRHNSTLVKCLDIKAQHIYHELVCSFEKCHARLLVRFDQLLESVTFYRLVAEVYYDLLVETRAGGAQVLVKRLFEILVVGALQDMGPLDDGSKA